MERESYTDLANPDYDPDLACCVNTVYVACIEVLL